MSLLAHDAVANSQIARNNLNAHVDAGGGDVQLDVSLGNTNEHVGEVVPEGCLVEVVDGAFERERERDSRLILSARGERRW